MTSQSSPQFQWGRIWRVPRPAFAILAVLLIHIAALAGFGHSQSLSIWSDVFELAATLLSAAICFLASRRSHGIARPFWLLFGSGLAIWALGKCLVIYDFHYLGLSTVRIAPLLLFFLAAAPMFVTVFLSRDDFRDTLNWEWILDASQILGLILVLYLFLIYVPLLYYGESAVSPLEDRLLLWRNIVLAAALLSRGVLSRSRTVRRLYLPVAVAIAVFAAATWFGNRAQELSDSPYTSWWDLAWSVPFCAIAWFAAAWDEQEGEESTTKHQPDPRISRVVFAYLPSLLLPILLLWQNRHILREQIFLALCGLIFSILLFNARLLLTQRRQRLTADALQVSEQQYRSLFERNMAGVFRSTIDGKLLDCNPALVTMSGYTREELLRNPMSNLYFGGDEERNRLMERLASEAPPTPIELCFRRKDGSPLWVLINANIEKLPDGTGIVEGTTIDITERKLNSIAVEDWKNRYDAAIQASRQIIYESDPDSKYVTLGGCVREILGYSVEELSGAEAWLALIHPEDIAHYLERLRAATTTRQTVEFEFRVRKDDNSYRMLQEQCRAAFDPSGKVLRIVGFLSDITDRRALESQLRQAQKMEAVGRLAGGVAHDFNNLLTIISGYSSILLERNGPSGPSRNELEQIRNATDRAAALTRQLLAFSRQTVLHPRHVNLNEIVHGVAKMLRRLIGEDIELVTALAAHLGTVRVDPGQIEQVLMNLVVNARDAMPNGGKLSIQTENINLNENYTRNHEYVQPGAYVLLSVSDNGTGIAREIQSRIFEPFFTTKEPGKGTGLGLPMVYGIVKQSGGSVELYSEVNQGTSVKIYLPRVDAAVDLIPAFVQPIAAANGSERILVVEDDPLVKGMVVDILKARGYTVYSAQTPEELEGIFQSAAKCDLLITDVVMPKMRGPELAARVARRWPGIRILYMSGYTSDAIVHHGVADGGRSFLQKPFVPAALAARVREVLDAPSPARS